MRVAQECDIILPWCAWEEKRKARSAAGAEGATNNRAPAPAVATMLALLVYIVTSFSMENECVWQDGGNIMLCLPVHSVYVCEGGG